MTGLFGEAIRYDRIIQFPRPFQTPLFVTLSEAKLA